MQATVLIAAHIFERGYLSILMDHFPKADVEKFVLKCPQWFDQSVAARK